MQASLGPEPILEGSSSLLSVPLYSVQMSSTPLALMLEKVAVSP